LFSLLGVGLLLAPFISLPPRLIGPLDASRFQAEQGHAFIVDLAALGIRAISDEGGESELVVREDGTPLAHGHQEHEAIREVGGGRYSHWNQWLYLSTSDNSDPRTNGRSYSVQVPRGLNGPRTLCGPWSRMKLACLALCTAGLFLLLLPWSPLTA